MTLQIGRFKLFIISVILLFLIFFAPNLRMLMIGEKVEGTVFKLSAFTAGEHNSRVNFIAKDKKEYRFEVNSNVVGQSTVIYDPKNPEDAYLYNFMSFVLEKIIFSLLAAIPSTIFVFFFLKKNQYLFIDLKRFKFYKGLKRWTEAEENTLKTFLNEELSYPIKPFEFAYLKHPDGKFASKLINVALQHLFIHKQLEITNKLVQVNKTDDKQKPRPFVSLGPNYSKENQLTTIENELLSIFENTENLRLHEIRQKLQQKYGVEFDKFHTEVIKPMFDSSPLFTDNKQSEAGKVIYQQITNRITFIENQLDHLLSENLLELANLLLAMNECWLFIPLETFDKIRTVLIERKSEIPVEILRMISCGYARVSIN
jgi:hypothetical protein